MEPDKLLDTYIEQWNKKVKKGKVLYLSRVEFASLELFVLWLTKKYTVEKKVKK